MGNKQWRVDISRFLIVELDIQISSFNRNMVANQYLKDGKCKLQLSDPIEAPTGYFVSLHPKGSKYTEAWSHA